MINTKIQYYLLFLNLLALSLLSLFFDSKYVTKAINLLNEKQNHLHNAERKIWWRGKMSESLINQSHPHAGAEDENGVSGMIVDPSPLRLLSHGLGSSELFELLLTNYSLNASTICPPSVQNSTITYGVEGYGGHQALLKVRTGLRKSIKKLEEKKKLQNSTRVKILCMIYTYPGNHHLLKSIVFTWGSKCDGFIAASTITDHSIGAINLLHQGPEEYENMWQKVRSMIAYAYDNYLNEFDYFYFCGDDVYAVIENMRVYLESEQVHNVSQGILDNISKKFPQAKKWQSVSEEEKPVPLRLCTPQLGKGVHCYGGPGYILNRRAIKLFGEEGLKDFFDNLTNNEEDVVTGRFFTERGVMPAAVQDINGSYRFWSSAESSFYFNGVLSPIRPVHLRARYKLSNNNGIDSVSEEQIAVHLKDEKGRLAKINSSIFEHMIRQHAILYDWCS